MHLARLSLVSFFCLSALVAGCQVGVTPPSRDSGTGDAGTVGGSCIPGSPGILCEGNSAVVCNDDGTEASRTDCATTGQVCVPSSGCLTCNPGITRCSGAVVERCNAAGTAYETVETCDAAAGLLCNDSTGTCTDGCTAAEASSSYIGCDYYAVTSLNSQVDAAFSPAVVISNPQAAAANVTVERGTFSQSITVAPGSSETVMLPWVMELKGMFGMEASALIAGGAYHVTSTLPVTVYQFNPLEFESGGEFSFSNDASLLLPTHVMTGNYTVMSRPALLNSIDDADGTPSPGFFNVVGVGTTPVNVQITYAGRSLAGSGGINAQGPGDSATYTLNPGDVLQIVGDAPATCTPGFTDTVPHPLFPGILPDTVIDYCTVTEEYDFTGTQIRADGPVQVLAGHNCAFVPFNRWACDHLEEAMFPEETWGTESIVSATQPIRSEPNLVRIISGADGVALSFDPVPAGVSNGMMLNRADILEFESSISFRVSGTGPIMVAQFLVGQDYAGLRTGGDMGEGDPAMSLGIPTEQFRRDYSFLAPTTYTTSFVNITAPTGAEILLDGNPVSGFAAVGTTGQSVARVPISGGRHSITGSQPFGIVVYGFGRYTSYMYPGGLDFNDINPLI